MILLTCINESESWLLLRIVLFTKIFAYMRNRWYKRISHLKSNFQERMVGQIVQSTTTGACWNQSIRSWISSIRSESMLRYNCVSKVMYSVWVIASRFVITAHSVSLSGQHLLIIEIVCLIPCLAGEVSSSHCCCWLLPQSGKLAPSFPVGLGGTSSPLTSQPQLVIRTVECHLREKAAHVRSLVGQNRSPCIADSGQNRFPFQLTWSYCLEWKAN